MQRKKNLLTEIKQLIFMLIATGKKRPHLGRNVRANSTHRNTCGEWCACVTPSKMHVHLRFLSTDHVEIVDTCKNVRQLQQSTPTQAR